MCGEVSIALCRDANNKHCNSDLKVVVVKMSSEDSDTERASLLLRQDGSIAKCQDGAVIVQFINSLRCSIIDPVEYREFLFEVFGPEIVNKCIRTNDGSSGSGVPRSTTRVLWNETTINILIQTLKLFKAEFMCNAERDAMYTEIANLINGHELEHYYTPALCQEKVTELTKEYSYQLFKNYVLEAGDNESSFKYFDEFHELFGSDFPASTLYSKGPNQLIEKKFKLLRKELRYQNKTILKNQKISMFTQKRIRRAFLQFENLVEEMRSERPPEDPPVH